MTKLLINLVIMALIFLVLYWVFSTFMPTFGVYSIPISILISVTLGFYIYTLIDNRMS